MGKSRSAVANALRLLNLSKDVRALVEEGKLSGGHARALVPLTARSCKKPPPPLSSRTICPSARRSCW